jgi:hypothetical protein
MGLRYTSCMNDLPIKKTIIIIPLMHALTYRSSTYFTITVRGTN